MIKVILSFLFEMILTMLFQFYLLIVMPQAQTIINYQTKVGHFV